VTDCHPAGHLNIFAGVGVSESGTVCVTCAPAMPAIEKQNAATAISMISFFILIPPFSKSIYFFSSKRATVIPFHLLSFAYLVIMPRQKVHQFFEIPFFSQPPIKCQLLTMSKE